MTNLNKTREEIIYELVLSLNKGDSYYAMQRIDFAIDQYNQLVKNGIVKEDENIYDRIAEQQKECNHDWIPMETIQTGTSCVTKFKCMKCGTTETKDTTGQYWKRI
jgi:hypothetical protein